MIRKLINITVIAFTVFGWRVAFSGGNLNNGSNAGLAYFNVNNDSSNDNSNVGAQLSIDKPMNAITTALAEKCKSLNGAGRYRTLRTNNADMKRHTNLFEKVYDKDNIRLAYYNAKKGKSYYAEVEKISSNPELYFDQMHQTSCLKGI